MKNRRTKKTMSNSRIEPCIYWWRVKMSLLSPFTPPSPPGGEREYAEF
jgi:hypothetical protein